MYDTLKLDKGMHHATDKSFSQILEELDPGSNYIGTPLEGLDAYERQLKRFNIKVSGANCDKIEKFFTVSSAEVLFPEFVKRCLEKGYNSTPISRLFATTNKIGVGYYAGLNFTETGTENQVGQGSTISNITTITENLSPISIPKYAKLIKMSFETLQRQRIDLLGAYFTNIGVRFGNIVLQSLSSAALGEGSPAGTLSSANITYADLITLLSSFTGHYRLSHILAAPALFAQILALPQLQDLRPTEDGRILLPFGAELVRVPNTNAKKLIGIDSSLAYELVLSPGLVADINTNMSNQMSEISISNTAMPMTIVSAAVKHYNLP